MLIRNSGQQFGLVAKLIHWTIALLILGLIWLGWYMVGLTYYDTWYNDSLTYHKALGMIVLALAIWPFVAVTLGGSVVLVMGFAFGVARLLFWIGYHLSPPLRGLGFAATFYPTVLAAFWSIVVWAY